VLSFVTRRLLLLIPTALVLITGVFFLIALVPGDPVQVMLGTEATEAAVEQKRKELGLDRPLLNQYLFFLSRLIKGDLGTSIYHREPVLKLFIKRIPNTMRLALFAIAFSLLGALPLGVLSAVKRYSVWDYSSLLLALIGVSVPVFWLGMVLIYVFGLKLRWLPVSGLGGSLFSFEGFKHTILPACTLGAYLLASSTRLLRSRMLDVLSADYIKTSRAKGLRESVVIWKHAFRNALNTLVTNVTLQVGVLIGGSFLTETVFAWPGVGRLLVQAIYRRDYPLIQGITLIIALMVVLINLLADISYMLLDPRVRYK